MIEFVDYNDLYDPKGKKVKKSTRRSRRKKTDDAVASTEQVENTNEEKSE
jgi:large subunit ribosomal protein L17